MDEYAGLRGGGESWAEYVEGCGGTCPWRWLGDGLERGGKRARECIEKGEPYHETYDDDALY